MEAALEKIRPHTTSNIAHQKAPATLLRALEATFQEQNTDASPAAYFAALMTTLDGTLQKNETGLGDGDLLPAELYLLALITPFVSPQIIRAQLNTLLTLTAPLFPSLLSQAPPLRSQLTLYHSVFLSLDKSQLEAPGVRQIFAFVLQLCLDSRPKVRKKAGDLVKDVLASPPPPLVRHPYADRVAEWVRSSLTDSGGLDGAIRILAFLRPVVPYLPVSVSTHSLYDNRLTPARRFLPSRLCCSHFRGWAVLTCPTRRTSSSPISAPFQRTVTSQNNFLKYSE